MGQHNNQHLRTPLARVKGLGSAKSGTGHWWAQRVTGTALVFLGLWFVASIICVDLVDFEATWNWLQEPLNAVLMMLFIGVLYYHGYIGLQVVIEDYVHQGWVKYCSLILIKFAFIIMAFLSIVSVLKIVLN